MPLGAMLTAERCSVSSSCASYEWIQARLEYRPRNAASRGADVRGRRGDASGRRYGARATGRLQWLPPALLVAAQCGGKIARDVGVGQAVSEDNPSGPRSSDLRPAPNHGTMACAASPMTRRARCANIFSGATSCNAQRAPTLVALTIFGHGWVPAGEGRLDRASLTAHSSIHAVFVPFGGRTTARKLTILPPLIA